MLSHAPASIPAPSSDKAFEPTLSVQPELLMVLVNIGGACEHVRVVLGMEEVDGGFTFASAPLKSSYEKSLTCRVR